MAHTAGSGRYSCDSDWGTPARDLAARPIGYSAEADKFLMRAVILAGGLGMRLRPYTMVLPKPLVPIHDRPILEHLISQLADHGVTHVDLCVGHLGGLIETYFRGGAHLPDGVRLVFHWEDEPLGTAGALTQIPDLEGSFLVLNGDLLTTLDFTELLRFHREKGATLTVATATKRVELGLGVIECSGGMIVGYREKPTLTFDVSMGVYVYQAAALAHIPDGSCQFPDLVMRLVKAGQSVASYPCDAEWYDIGTIGEYERATRDVEARAEVFGFRRY
jgi:NDP-sugar pyrophosphorylase family protein